MIYVVLPQAIHDDLFEGLRHRQKFVRPIRIIPEQVVDFLHGIRIGFQQAFDELCVFGTTEAGQGLDVQFESKDIVLTHHRS